MYSNNGYRPESRPQLVPSPSHGVGDAGSPLSLESWYASDLDAWLRDSEVPSKEPSKIDFSTQQQEMNKLLDSSLLSYRNTSARLRGLTGDSPNKLASRTVSYKQSVHVNIPSPESSFGSTPAESPTLYDTVLPASDSRSSSNVVSSPPYLPLPVEEIKRELPDEFRNGCPTDLGSLYGALHTVVKAEDAISGPCQLSQETFQQVQSLAMEQVSRDIDLACQVLAISRDPTDWSAADVRAWFVWTLKQYNLPNILVDYFAMDGVALCSLTEDDFQRRAPCDGETLFAQLDIWKTAVNIQKNGQNMSMSPFRVEDSILDINGLLNQWSTGSISAINTPPSRNSVDETVGNKIQNGHISVSSGSGCGNRTFNSSIIMGTEGLPVLGSSKHVNDSAHSDDETSEDSCEIDRFAGTRSGSHSHIHLWQFLKELLSQPQMYGSCIRWLDRSKSVFKIEDSVRVARLWGKRKNRPAMNYDKLSRSIRQYYKKGIMKKTERSQRLVYQFCHPYGL
ncbi:DNA-binding protein D-ETS-4-like [Tachypleus tridentatus]|uniref:DNA-binding protein D-ETS-4-like n=1 Tax=Tachypleus tridentatus TaxID=6853 RepID=UPI003FD35E72